MKNPAKKSLSGGFTLVEALVAIFILMVAIVAPLQIAYQGLAATTYAKNELTAEYLAQDAAEYLLARETEDPTNWLTTFADCTTSDGCALSTDSLTLSEDSGSPLDCPEGVCPVLEYNNSTGEYTQQSGSGSATSFTRNIKLTSVSHESDNSGIAEVQATITVRWSSTLAANTTFVLRTSYFNETTP